MKKHTILVVAFILMVAVPAWAQQVRVNHNRTPLRSEPTQTSKVLEYYQAGSALVIISLNDGWYKVRDPKTKREGYILATLVDALPGGPQPQPKPAPPNTQAKPANAPGAIPSAATPVSTSGQPAPTKAPAKSPAAKAKRWTDYGFIGVGAVYQAGSPAFSTEYSYTEYLEPVTVKTDYPATKGPGFDAAGAVRVWRNLAAGVGVTGGTRTGDATVNASIPHPFYFEVGRPIEGSVNVTRTEYAAHVHALWVIPAGERLLVAVGGGPSFFSIRQSLVDSVTYTESYPYDSAAFASAPINEASGSAVGFGVTLDVGYYFSRTIGIGGVVRYAKATVSLPDHSSTLTVDAGGFEAGVGLRVRFRQGKPKPKTPPVAPKPLKK